MTEKQSSLPHHRLLAYRIAFQLLVAVRDARLSDAGLRERALRSAQSACLNVAEAAGRTSKADRARVFAIARGEIIEVSAALDIAGALHGQNLEHAQALAGRAYALLTALILR